jgi:predicted enzyme related to lactoylglutathione lyase
LLEPRLVHGGTIARPEYDPAVKVHGLAWLGTRTAEFDGMVAFLEDVFKLTPAIDEPGFAVFRLGNGDTVEVFGADDEHHAFFTTGPVAGFEVDDVAAAQAEMEAAGIEFFGQPTASPDGYAWSHFRAPDGNVYEITSRPQPAG